MNETTSTLTRFCLWMGCVFVTVAVAVALTYFFFYQPMWATVDMASVERLLRDPSTPIETVRRTALQSQATVIAGFDAVDAAIQFVTILSAISGAGFLYVFVVLRRVRQEADGNAL